MHDQRLSGRFTLGEHDALLFVRAPLDAAGDVELTFVTWPPDRRPAVSAAR